MTGCAKRRLGWCFAVWVTLLPQPAHGQTPDTRIAGRVPSYKEAAVVYDFAWKYYAKPANLALVHEGRADLGTMGVVPIDNFDWARPGGDASYWVAMENFRYLLPAIESDAQRDRDFVVAWITRWLDQHPLEHPNPGATDAMSVGHRAATFVWYLRKRHERGEPEDAFVRRIMASLEWHRDYLKDHYNLKSNHAIWEAVGLFETTRAHPDSELSELALNRLLEATRFCVSDLGVEMEHAADYHFYVWNWLKHFVEYLSSLREMQWSGLSELADCEKKMRDASYYFYDHKRNIVQLGDTDAKRIQKTDMLRPWRAPVEPVLFDEEAGVAVYKDRLKRYLVFGIQNKEQTADLPYHVHDDVLSVYYASDGQVILGDSGRYSYGRGPIKTYFDSNTAHNIIAPADELGKSGYGSHMFHHVDSVSSYRGEQHFKFSAAAYGGKVTRVVNLPVGRPELEVFDLINRAGQYVVLWHLGPDVTGLSDSVVTRAPVSGSKIYAWEITSSNRRKYELTVMIQTDTEHAVSLVSGQEDPYLGWYSSGQFQSRPASVIRIDLRVPRRGWAALSTRVRPGGF